MPLCDRYSSCSAVQAPIPFMLVSRLLCKLKHRRLVKLQQDRDICLRNVITRVWHYSVKILHSVEVASKQALDTEMQLNKLLFIHSEESEGIRNTQPDHFKLCKDQWTALRVLGHISIEQTQWQSSCVVCGSCYVNMQTRKAHVAQVQKCRCRH